MATKERVLRMTVLQYGSSKLTDDEFHKHWTQKHAPIASGWLARNGILGDTQHCPADMREKVQDIADYAGGSVAPFEAYAEFTVRNVEDLMAATQDPECPVKMQPDESFMFEQGKMQITVGREETYVQDGKVANIVDGKSAWAA